MPSRRVNGNSKRQFLKASMNQNWNFLRGGRFKLKTASVRGVRIFSGPTYFGLL